MADWLADMPAEVWEIVFILDVVALALVVTFVCREWAQLRRERRRASRERDDNARS